MPSAIRSSHTVRQGVGGVIARCDAPPNDAGTDDPMDWWCVGLRPRRTLRWGDAELAAHQLGEQHITGFSQSLNLFGIHQNLSKYS